MPHSPTPLPGELDVRLSPEATANLRRLVGEAIAYGTTSWRNGTIPRSAQDELVAASLCQGQMYQHFGLTHLGVEVALGWAEA